MDFRQTGTVGRSWLGNEITFSKIGTGIKKILFSGGFSAADSTSPKALCTWAEEAEKCYGSGENFGEFRAAVLFAKVTVYVIPNVNPDGIFFRTKPDKFNPFYERSESIKRNHPGKEWRANARGTDLSKNFAGDWMRAKMTERENGIFTSAPCGYGGEYPESELETSSLCSFIRRIAPDFICIFSDENRGIYTDKCINISDSVQQKAIFISKLKDLSIIEREYAASAATLPVWAKKELDTGAFSVGLGKTDDIANRDIITLCAAL